MIYDSYIHAFGQGKAIRAVGDLQFQELPTRSEDAWRGEMGWDGYRKRLSHIGNLSMIYGMDIHLLIILNEN